MKPRTDSIHDMESTGCDLCGSWRSRVLFELADWRYRRPAPTYRICRCLECAFAYLNPRPAAASMGYHYPADYDDRRIPASQFVRDRYEAQAEFIGPGPGRLLDIGSGSGDFINWISHTLWDASGIEPYARRSQRSGSIRNLFVTDECLDDERYEAITAWHVLEHVRSPTDFLVRIRELLAPGGKFYLSVPNFDSYHSRWLKAEDVPRHLSFFTLATLRRFAEKSGLAVTRHSYDERFAAGAVGRGSLTGLAYRTVGGLSVYEHLVARSIPGKLDEEFPRLRQPVRLLQRLERWILAPERLRRSGKMGVIAVEMEAIG